MLARLARERCVTIPVGMVRLSCNRHSPELFSFDCVDSCILLRIVPCFSNGCSKIKVQFSSHMFELLPGKNTFEDRSLLGLPCSKTIYDKVAEVLPIRMAHQGRSSFAQAQQNHVNTRLRHKILAPETVHDLHLKPGFQ